MATDDTIRIYVGTDRSQLLAVPVLEYSIKRHTKAKVEVIPMLDLPVPTPKDPRNSQRTGFSFSRFCIPKLAGYKGKAIYMDADMLVFKDIEELWNIPFDGAKVIVQKEVKHQEETLHKHGAPKERKKQCAVMLLNCEELSWDIDEIIKGMDAEKYNYDQLMSELCILDESEVKYGVPFEWNSLEHWDNQTCLIHYTDVTTQPWTCCGNKNAYLWFSEVRRMINNGALSWSQIENEINLGYFRPSLIRDIKYRHLIPKFLHKLLDTKNSTTDKLSGYIPHKAVYEQKRIRNKAIKAYEAKLANEAKKKDSSLHVTGSSSAISHKETTLAKKLFFIANANIPTLQLSFINPLLNDIAEGNIATSLLTEAELKENFGSSIRSIESLDYSIKRISEFSPDAVIFCRYSGPHAKPLVEFCKTQGIPTIFHVDDDLLNVPMEIGEKKYAYHNNPKRLTAVETLLSRCDLVYCSNTRLENRFKQLGFDSNFYSGKIYSAGKVYREPSNEDAVKIGYMGFDHAHDFELVSGAIAQILTDFPTVTFELFGSIPLPAKLSSFGDRVKCIEPVKDYQEFMQKFASLGWNIAICPLSDTPFNAVKSNTKWVEYTSVGAAVVATKGTIYDDCCSQQCGLLADDSEWYEKIVELINDKNYRNELVRNAQNKLVENFSAEQLRAQILEVLSITKKSLPEEQLSA